MAQIPPKNARLKICDEAQLPVKYNQRSTNKVSLDLFAGDALGDQGYGGGADKDPFHSSEDLEAKFQSHVNRNDLVSRYGPRSVDRKLGKQRQSLADEVFAWMRNKGESLFK